MEILNKNDEITSLNFADNAIAITSGKVNKWYFEKLSPNGVGTGNYFIPSDKMAKEIANNIAIILQLYKDGGMYYYTDDEGVKMCGSTPNELSAVLQKYLNEHIPIGRAQWVTVARNISPYIIDIKQNTRFLAFNNISFDIVKSIESKKLVKAPVTGFIDNKFKVDYIEDESKLNKPALKLYKKIMDNYTRDIETNEEKVAWIESIMMKTGYLLSPCNWLEKMMVWRSKPGAGKSTWLEVIANLYGSNSAVYNPYGDDFAEFPIYQKRFIYKGELESKQFKRQYQLQSIVSSEKVPVRASGGRTFEWTPNAQVLFLTNKTFYADKEDGIWDRIDFFYFPTKIRGMKELSVNNIKRLMKDEKFLEVFVHFAVKGLERVLAEGDIRSNQNIVDNEMKKQNSVKNFLDEFLSEEDDEVEFVELVSQKDFFAMYRKYITENNVEDDLNKKDFEYEAEGYTNKNSHPKVRKINGKSVRAWGFERIGEFPWEE